MAGMRRGAQVVCALADTLNKLAARGVRARLQLT